MKSEELAVADRLIRIVTGSGSQTINVHSEDESPGDRIYKIRDPSQFVTAARLESRAFTSLDELDECLRSEYGAALKPRA